MTSATPATDTTPDALAVQLDCLREMSPHERLSKTFAWSRDIREMTFRAIRRRHPALDENEIRLRFIELVYGQDLADEIRQWQASESEETLH